MSNTPSFQNKLIIKRRRPSAPSRKPPGTDAKAFRRHAKRVGMAVLAWNDLHANLYLIFWFLIGPSGHPDEKQVAYGVWHTIQNESTQRDMIKEAATVKLANDRKLLSRITWILEKAERLSPYRNMAAHTAVLFHWITGAAPRPDPWSSRALHRDRYRLIDHDHFWRSLAGDLSALSRYAARLSDDLWRPGHTRSSFRKPALLSLPLIDRIEGQIGRQKQIAAQSGQPISSRPKARKGKKPRQRKRANS